MNGIPKPQGIESHAETVTGVDGNDITLYVDRPVGAQGPLPGLLHLHGGGMAILQAADEFVFALARPARRAGLRGRRSGVPQLGVRWDRIRSRPA
jgi:acetyl esterase/lipase